MTTTKLSAEAAAQPYKQARETQDEVDVLRAQRDELLAACNGLVGLLQLWAARQDEIGAFVQLNLPGNHRVDAACAALAR